MVGLTYTTFINSVANLMPTTATDSSFLSMVPNMIDDMEQRLYRELDLLNAVTTDSSAAFSTSTRAFNLPSSNGTFVVVDAINVITPSGTSSPDAGTRNALTPAAKEMLDFLWPSATGSTVPVYWAPVTQNQIIVGPWPDAAYQVEVIGTIRPAPLSASNLTTILSVNFPDLTIAAAMVFASGYMKNYGMTVDDPRQGVSWEAHLQELLKSAQTEEQRKKFNMAGWSDKQPSPSATPPRT